MKLIVCLSIVFNSISLSFGQSDGNKLELPMHIDSVLKLTASESFRVIQPNFIASKSDTLQLYFLIDSIVNRNSAAMQMFPVVGLIRSDSMVLSLPIYAKPMMRDNREGNRNDSVKPLCLGDSVYYFNSKGEEVQRLYGMEATGFVNGIAFVRTKTGRDGMKYDRKFYLALVDTAGNYTYLDENSSNMFTFYHWMRPTGSTPNYRYRYTRKWPVKPRLMYDVDGNIGVVQSNNIVEMPIYKKVKIISLERGYLGYKLKCLKQDGCEDIIYTQ